MIDQTNYLDLWNISNELIGAVWLTIAFGALLIFFICIKNRIPYKVMSLFMILYGGIIYASTFLDLIWVFVLIVVGLIFYYQILKVLRNAG